MPKRRERAQAEQNALELEHSHRCDHDQSEQGKKMQPVAKTLNQRPLCPDLLFSLFLPVSFPPFRVVTKALPSPPSPSTCGGRSQCKKKKNPNLGNQMWRKGGSNKLPVQTRCCRGGGDAASTNKWTIIFRIFSHCYVLFVDNNFPSISWQTCHCSVVLFFFFALSEERGN